MSSEEILRRDDVLSRVKVSRTTLWRMITRGEFPAPLNNYPAPGSRVLGWKASVVDAWLESRE